MSSSKRKGRPIDPSSYYSLLNHYNRDMSKAERIVCECGKILYRSQLDGHRTTKMHEQLLKYKQLAEQGTNLMDHKKQEEVREEKDKDKEKETLDELLLKVATDLEYRKKVRTFMEVLDKE